MFPTVGKGLRARKGVSRGGSIKNGGYQKGGVSKWGYQKASIKRGGGVSQKGSNYTPVSSGGGGGGGEGKLPGVPQRRGTAYVAECFKFPTKL